MHLENLDSRKRLVQDFTSSQCNGEAVTKLLKGIRTTKVVVDIEKDADDFFSAYQSGFKGLD